MLTRASAVDAATQGPLDWGGNPGNDMTTPTRSPSTDERTPASPGAAVFAVLRSPSVIVPLVLVWAVVAASVAFGPTLFAAPIAPIVAGGSFVVILAAIVVASFGVVREAEHLAQALGEPFGTLVLTLSIVLIEVILISSVMLGPAASPTIGRDSLFAVMMIILNGVMGVALVAGGLKHGQQAYNRQGTSSYLAMIVVLSLLSLVLPNFTSSTADGSLVPLQAIVLSVLAAALYAFFLILQTTTHRDLFVQPGLGDAPQTGSPAQHSANAPSAPSTAASRIRRATLLTHSVLLVIFVLPIVLLSHDLAIVLDVGIELLDAPAVLSGVLIAAIVFTPEAATAIRASLGNETQRTINLGLGAFVSTVGLTIPAVLIIGLMTGKAVVLGESPANMLLIVTTLVLTIVTFTARRTTSLHGAAHLVLFGMFVLLIFAP